MPRFLVPLIVLAVTACEQDPATRCAGPQTRELRTVETLIADSRSALDRGYRMERAESGARVNFCLGGARSNVGLSYCTDPGAARRAVAIDTEAEKRKLASLEARRDTLMARIDACGRE
ncbi:MAG: hypothetical protein WBB85_01360 [Albidovulum sp.]|uniref:hypothetical protein n=1 Tax=Albidovulum sp. TaxID=1872424 RepID=UPI003CB1E761